MNSTTPEPTLHQSVEFSLAKLKTLQEKYLKGEIDETDYIDSTNTLAEETLQLIAASRQKKNRFKLVLSALFSLLLIGIPFFVKLLREKRRFHTEMEQLERRVHEAKVANEQVLLLSKIKALPSLMNRIKERFRDHRREELINAQLIADWEEYQSAAKESRPICDKEFERDMERGASFQRIDQNFHIEDKAPLPSPLFQSEKRAPESLLLLSELLQKPEDERWFPILQMTVSHASVFTAFKAVLSAFNIDAATVQQEINGKYFSIKAVFSDQSSPVILEIIRHPSTLIIERVNVRVKASADIVKYQELSLDDEPVILAPGAIIEELHYSIVFPEGSHPVIEDFHSQINVFIS